MEYKTNSIRILEDFKKEMDKKPKRKKKAIDICADEFDDDYETLRLGLYVDKFNNVEGFCPHCNITINTYGTFKNTVTIEGHTLRINNKSISFSCPAHGGWIISYKTYINKDGNLKFK